MISVKCKEHPRYKANRYPISECIVCKVIWNFVNDDVWNKYYIRNKRMVIS